MLQEPCLLLCPQITVLSLAFSDQAFAAEELSEPGHLFRLRIHVGLNQLELPWKTSILDTPLFRHVEPCSRGHRVSHERCATDNWVRKQMKALGEVTGFELPVGPYCFRRGNGEALDSSSEFICRAPPDWENANTRLAQASLATLSATSSYNTPTRASSTRTICRGTSRQTLRPRTEDCDHRRK